MRGIFPSVFRDPFPRWAGGRPSDGRTEAEVSCYRILCIHVSAATAAEKCRIGSQLPRSIADGRTDGQSGGALQSRCQVTLPVLATHQCYSMCVRLPNN